MSEYDEQDWETLLFAPLWVLIAVAGADSKVDDKEWQAFHQELKDARQYNNPLTREVLKNLRKNFDEVYEAFQEDDTDIEDGLGDVADIVDENEDEDVAFGFKADLIALGIMVAQASGGWVLGSSFSDKEQEALSFVANALGLDEQDMEEILESLSEEQEDEE